MGQVLNLTQSTENSFEAKKIIGVILVDLTAAYDTVNYSQQDNDKQTI